MTNVLHGWKQHLASLVCMKCGKLFDCQADLQHHFEEQHPLDPPSQRHIQQSKNNAYSSRSDNRQVLTEHSPDLNKKLQVTTIKKQAYSLSSSSSESYVCTENKKPNDKKTVPKKPEKKKTGYLCCKQSSNVKSHLQQSNCSSHIPPDKKKRAYRHECRSCSMTFITPSKLKRHALTHTKTKPYKCLECHKKFSRHDNLVTHEMSVHCHIKTFQCGSCGQNFGSNQSLVYHSVACTGTVQQLQRHFVCDFCERSFTLKRSLCSHIAYMHLEFRPHTCPNCPRKFYRASHLHRHVASVHINRRPFWCAYCHHRSATKSNLVIHIMSIHKPKSRN